MDIRPMQKRVRKLSAEIKMLFGRLKATKNFSLRKAYDKEIASLQEELDAAEVEIRDARKQDTALPAPLDRDRVETYLKDYRDLFDQEIPAAAEAIRAFTGRISIRQEGISRRGKGAKWIATFSPDFLALLRKVAKGRDYPESVTLDNPRIRNWILLQQVEVVIDGVPIFLEKQAAILELIGKGVSRGTIAMKFGIDRGTVDNAIRAANGKPTRPRPKYESRSRDKEVPKRITYRDIAAEVARRRDELGHTFRKIAVDLGHCTRMIYRAYDHTHPEIIEEAVKTGKPLRRSGQPYLDQKKKDRIAKMIRAGERTCDIVREVGCCRSTVSRIQNRINE